MGISLFFYFPHTEKPSVLLKTDSTLYIKLFERFRTTCQEHGVAVHTATGM